MYVLVEHRAQRSLVLYCSLQPLTSSIVYIHAHVLYILMSSFPKKFGEWSCQVQYYEGANLLVRAIGLCIPLPFDNQILMSQAKIYIYIYVFSLTSARPFSSYPNPLPFAYRFIPT